MATDIPEISKGGKIQAQTISYSFYSWYLNWFSVDLKVTNENINTEHKNVDLAICMKSMVYNGNFIGLRVYT